MPGQAIVHPEDLQRFAAALASFDRELSDSVSRLLSEFARVSETWRDEQQQRFAAEFEAMTAFLEHFHQSAEEHIPQLQAKAGIIIDYMNLR